MELDYTGILNAIQDANVITIYRHTHPDCDALSSQNALYTWITKNYPDKEVYMLGDETTDQTKYPPSHKVALDKIQQSTAIVVDTANKERVDDQRFLQANHIVKIDHHPNNDPFGDENYVVETAAATCEILTNFFTNVLSKEIDYEIAEYLYKGLLTDTLCFRTSNTTKHTLQMAAILAGYNIDIPAINRELFDISYANFEFSTWIRQNVQRKGEHFAYVVIHQDVLDRFHLTGSSARNRIDELGHVKEFTIWALFTQRPDSELFDGSLRSKTATINTIASKYNGGGHKNACGVKDLNETNLQSLIDDLYKIS